METGVSVGTNRVGSVVIVAKSVGLAESTALLVASGPEPQAVYTKPIITR